MLYISGDILTSATLILFATADLPDSNMGSSSLLLASSCCGNAEYGASAGKPARARITCMCCVVILVCVCVCVCMYVCVLVSVCVGIFDSVCVMRVCMYVCMYVYLEKW